MPHTSKNIDAVEDEELVLSQEDAPVPEKIRRTVHHFEHKNCEL